jgi:hypothetical protein
MPCFRRTRPLEPRLDVPWKVDDRRHAGAVRRAIEKGSYQNVSEGITRGDCGRSERAALAAEGQIPGGKQFVEEMRKKLGRPWSRITFARDVAFCSRSICTERLLLPPARKIMGCVRDRHDDPWRDLVLLAARQFGRKTLRELAREVEVDYGRVSNALYRISKQMESDLKFQREWNNYSKCINQAT